jgi:dihydrofolate reductase
MRKLVISMNVTLDGFLSGPQCELDWHFRLWSSEMALTLAEQLGRADTVLLGRKTYLGMWQQWSAITSATSAAREDMLFIERMNACNKLVYCSQPIALPWLNSARLTGDLRTAISNMKRMPGRDIVVYGSGRLVAALQEAGLADEYQVWLHPVAIGSGKPFFTVPASFRINDIRQFANGVVIISYRPLLQA